MAAKKNRKPQTQTPKKAARKATVYVCRISEKVGGHPLGSNLSAEENRHVLAQEILYMLATLGDSPKLRNALTATSKVMPVEQVN